MKEATPASGIANNELLISFQTKGKRHGLLDGGYAFLIVSPCQLFLPLLRLILSERYAIQPFKRKSANNFQLENRVAVL